MTIEEIFNDLRSPSAPFPRAAVEEAIAQREEITPELLRLLEVAAQDPGAAGKGPDGFLFTFAAYLVAQFRDKSAFPRILKMVTGPGDSAYEVLGESITTDLGRILASVYDGNLAALKQVIEDPQMNEYVRSGVLNALLQLVRSQQMSREELLEYLRHLLRSGAERDDSFFWDGIVSFAVDLPAPELLEEITRLFDDNRLCLETYFDAEAVNAEMEHSKQNENRTCEPLIRDVIREMQWWACFEPRDPSAEEADDMDEDWLDETDPSVFHEQEPVVEPLVPQSYEPLTPCLREGPKIGRNDPCPCGSGKKYKKCCGP